MKDISGCAISGIMNRRGELMPGELIAASLCNMEFRSNGLGAGFAGYGIYPEHRDHYAFHLMYTNRHARAETEGRLKRDYIVWREEAIPTRHNRAIADSPLLFRYFISPKEDFRAQHPGLCDDDIVIQTVMEINRFIAGAYVFSSGKNMGVFKGVGMPADIADFFRIDEYRAYIWSGHGRFPTNTPGWWGGAHPFSLLDWSIVHNGEISSYGTNLRYLASYGYHCTLKTDTEVIAYLFDLLVRRHKLPVEIVCRALAPPFWSQIESLEGDSEAEILSAIRVTYESVLLNGPFSIVVGHRHSMIGLTDRVKLRPLVAAEEGDVLYIASEESAIREICPSPERLWALQAGVPVIGVVERASEWQRVS